MGCGPESLGVPSVFPGTHRHSDVKMQGVFYCEDKFKYSPVDIDGDLLLYSDVVMERDVGPYKKGEKVSSASVSAVTGEVHLLTTDDDGDDIKEHVFNVDVTYKVREDKWVLTVIKSNSSPPEVTVHSSEEEALREKDKRPIDTMAYYWITKVVV